MFQTSHLDLLCHAFTHADAPVHFAPDGVALAGLPVETWVGPAAVVELGDCAPLEPIGVDLLARRAAHLDKGGIALLRTRWDSRVSVHTPEYWAQAPYLAREAAQWLRADRGVRCVGFDFPQDRGIRFLVAGESPGRSEFATHDVLLAEGVGMLEYLGGLDRLGGDHTFLVAVPLNIPDADGAPVRAVALEGFDDVPWAGAPGERPCRSGTVEES